MRGTLTPMELLRGVEHRQAAARYRNLPKHGFSGMRKEVKRSLVIWPTIASTAIVGLTCCAIRDSGPNRMDGHRRVAASVVGTTWERATRFIDSVDDRATVAAAVAARTAEVASEAAAAASGLTEVVEVQVASAIGTHREAFERIDHGARAMKLPQRLEFLLASPTVEDDVAATRWNETQIDVPPVPVEIRAPEVFAPTLEMAIQQEPVTSPSDRGPWTSRYADAYLAKVAPSIEDSSETTKETTADVSANPVSASDAPPLVGPVEPQTPVSHVAPERLAESLHRSTLTPRVFKDANPDDELEAGHVEGPKSPESIVDSDSAPSLVVDTTADAPRPAAKHGSPATWPITTSLSEQLSALSAAEPSAGSKTWVTTLPASPTAASSNARPEQWAHRVAETLQRLQTLDRLGDDRAGVFVAELDSLAMEGMREAEPIADRTKRIQWLTAAYAVARRAAVWQSVWEVTNGTDVESTDEHPRRSDSDSVSVLITQVRSELEETGDQTGWHSFLLLDDLRRAADDQQSQTRAESACRFLARLEHPSLHRSHEQWINRSSVSALADAVRPWTSRAIDYASLLSDIEQQESASLDSSASEIAAAVATLRFAENEKLIKVARAIETHYRNANLRVAISDDMLTRLLPTIQPQTVPIRTRVMGSRVHGNSRVESDLQLQLNPSPDHWSINLRTLGNVQTRSTGYKGPVTVRTQGHSSFVAATPIDVTDNGVQVGDPRVSVRGKTNLQGIQSKYDGWPLISRLIRGIAESQYESMAPQSNRIANNLMRSQIADAIDKTLDERIAEATERLRQAVIGPLGRMQLDPQVIDMRTTPRRLLARYRLAGDTQLAAFTPRPRAPSESVMSVQVHQSAINNALQQLIPTGEQRSVRQTISDAMRMLGAEDAPLPDDLPEDVTIQFSKVHPVSVQIEDGQVWIEMRVVRLNKGDKLKLNRFIVRAAYRPEIDGIDVALLRDGHLRISGSGMSMRERLPVRAIFNKVLSPTREIPLTLPTLTQHQAVKDLSLTQLELRDGWIGFALGHPDAPRLALAAATAKP